MHIEIIKALPRYNIAGLWHDMHDLVFDLPPGGLPVASGPIAQVGAVEKTSGVDGWGECERIHENLLVLLKRKSIR
jgi:hypothetical protein